MDIVHISDENRSMSVRFRKIAGLTVVELLVSIVVLLLLGGLIFIGQLAWRTRAEAVRCGNNLRSLQVSFASYIQDKGHWPQEPPEIFAANDSDQYEDWWFKEMRPYNAPPEIWQCPTIMRKIVNKRKERRPLLHYTPTMFDDKPFTPYKWSTQPWLIEIGNMHGAGALICFPDGSIKTMNEVVKG